ncbi:fungal hydrophobin domain-containing protein [Pochonia chlamydosporia 170]|uniref:Fungal hydrophobin domain-containing protein n=1 Tax=Pochonia chlamydosporia 170 TaxID=1380566 RepID=A0A219AS48_METCM|nr:fungal hydrophobin domain-containing protein [Pochonia chlamydosporia 170]OWT43591.1 fungal hydrophobin domain-containing protein [Pochonia chlamydosporia 170]
MKFLAVASLLFASTLAVPTSQCGECQHHHPGGNNPGGNNPGGNNPGGNNPGGNNPGGNNPGGNNPGGNNPGGNNPGGNNPGGNNPGGNNPGGNNPGSYNPCPSGLYANPQCCSTDVLGVAGLDCKSPSSAPTSGDNFKAVCSASGKQAKCCVVPVAGQAVLCTDAPGGNNPGGNNPGGNNPGGNNPGGNNPGGNNPGGNNPGGNNPGGNNPGNNPGNSKVCPSGLYSNPQCCDTNVLGVAALGCGNPSSAPTSGDNFKSTCAASGKKAVCCVVPVAGQALLCEDAIGGNNPGNNPGGNNPGGNNPGNNPGGNNPGGNNPGGNNPGGNNPGGNPPASKVCPKGLYSNPQCCSTNVLGVAALDCKNPSSTPSSGANFKTVCSAQGRQPLCCVLPVAGQDVLCTKPVGA